MKKFNIVKSRTCVHGDLLPLGAWYGSFAYTRTNRAFNIEWYINDFDARNVVVWAPYSVTGRFTEWRDHRPVTKCVMRRGWRWQIFKLENMPAPFQAFINAMIARYNPHGVCTPWIERSGRLADVPRERKLDIFNSSIHYVGA